MQQYVQKSVRRKISLAGRAQWQVCFSEQTVLVLLQKTEKSCFILTVRSINHVSTVLADFIIIMIK